ncbi:MAG: universal stress protein [Dehalococcoidales bacterium]
MYKIIVVPLDGSELAECVLPHLESIARSSGTEEVILVTVMERVINLIPKNVPERIPENSEASQPTVVFSDRPYTGRHFEFDSSLKMPLITGKMFKQGQRYLAKVAEELLKKGIKSGIVVLMGEAAEQIVDFAGSEKAELIIMASHGRSGFSRWAMGSVAEKVFHGSSVPILLVKASTEDKVK